MIDIFAIFSCRT